MHFKSIILILLHFCMAGGGCVVCVSQRFSRYFKGNTYPKMAQLHPMTDEAMDCEENTKISLETFDSEPGFYQLVIKPMLTPGHENELVLWLKEFGLISQGLKCKSFTEDQSVCDSPMVWTRASNMKDLYQWRCKQGSCKGRRRIRETSIFLDVKCTLKDSLRILLGWCKNIKAETLAEILSLKPQVIKSLYRQCATNAEKHITSNLKEWSLGGPDKYVVVDLYPDGCAKGVNGLPQNQNNNEEPILCLAEIKTFPTKYWFHRIDRQLLHRDPDKANQESLSLIQTMVKPGTTLIADATAKVCSVDKLKTLAGYPLVVSTDDLMRHNTQTRNLLDILEAIWSPAIAVCEEAQSLQKNQIQGFLHSNQWLRRFGDKSFQTLLLQLSDATMRK